jgi:hypothetical protein
MNTRMHTRMQKRLAHVRVKKVANLKLVLVQQLPQFYLRWRVWMFLSKNKVVAQVNTQGEKLFIFDMTMSI